MALEVFNDEYICLGTSVIPFSIIRIYATGWGPHFSLSDAFYGVPYGIALSGSFAYVTSISSSGNVAAVSVVGLASGVPVYIGSIPLRNAASVVHGPDYISVVGDDVSIWGSQCGDAACRVAYHEESQATGIPSLGAQTSAVVFDYDNDDHSDVLITPVTAIPAIFRFDHLNGSVPHFEELNDAFASGSDLHQGMSFSSAAYVDCDDGIDIFMGAGAYGTGQLYLRNQSNQFVLRNGLFPVVHDVASDTDVSAAISAQAAAWADYDKDGDVDLFLIRSAGATIPSAPTVADNHILLRNDLRDDNEGTCYGAFTDVTSTGTISLSTSAVWQNIDEDVDGRADLLIGGLGSAPAPIVLIQNAGGTFSDETERLPANEMRLETGVALADLTNDGHPDLIETRRDDNANLSVVIRPNDGTGHFADVASANSLPASRQYADHSARVFDVNMDGRKDIVVAARDELAFGATYINQGPFLDHLLLEDLPWDCSLVGPSAIGWTGVSDWDRDGFADVLFGRESALPVHYRAVGGYQAGPEFLHGAIRLRLSSPDGVNDRMGVGALIKVTLPSWTQHYWVNAPDGGACGSGGEILIPVAETEGTVDVTIDWPNGWQQIAAVAVNTTGAAQVVLDDTNPTVVNSSVSFYSTWNAEENLYAWNFIWDTEYRSDWSLDRVSIGACACYSAFDITPSSYGAEQEITRLASGRYQHRLTCPAACQAPCTVTYTVTSIHRMQPVEIGNSCTKSFTVRFCPQQ
jgi:hypothetical protein